MGRFKDLTGLKFDRLTVLSFDHKESRGLYGYKYFWKCRCECGKICVVRGDSLTGNKTRSCGCLAKVPHYKDLTGQRFDRLTVIELDRVENRHAYWRCHCDCGNDCIAEAGSLKSGNTRSCGCLAKERHFRDLTGRQFGKLKVLEKAYSKALKSGGYEQFYKCQCECGNITIVRGGNLRNGATASCGCGIKEAATTHGMSKSAIYRTWGNIKDRCNNPNCKNYFNYGGRGIKICDRWINFENFYEDVSKLPHFGEKGYSLDRIDNDGDYCPDNVRWATAKEQERNKRNNVIVEYQGQKMTLSEASEKSGVQAATLRRRMNHGETGEYLFRLPTKHK